MKFYLNIKKTGLAFALMLPVIGVAVTTDYSNDKKEQQQIIISDNKSCDIVEWDSKNTNDIDSALNKIDLLYKDMNLDGIIDYELFCSGIKGLDTYEPKNKNIITLIDFSKPSDQERFYVLDIENKKLLYKTLVAHGRNSGMKFAEKFSNVECSNMSSPGFYTTDETYVGGNGYSLRLDGLEPGKNDNARQRAIVIHGANYVTYEMAKTQGRIGRSLGCPALPQKQAKQIIDTIKQGALLYIHI